MQLYTEKTDGRISFGSKKEKKEIEFNLQGRESEKKAVKERGRRLKSWRGIQQDEEWRRQGASVWSHSKCPIN